jgi:hypothetical protein
MVLKWHVFAIAILIGWFELVLLSGRLPQLSVQLETIIAVTVIFLKIMKGYVLLLVVFALAFYVLFTDNFDVDYAELFSGSSTRY